MKITHGLFFFSLKEGDIVTVFDNNGVVNLLVAVVELAREDYMKAYQMCLDGEGKKPVDPAIAEKKKKTTKTWYDVRQEIEQFFKTSKWLPMSGDEIIKELQSQVKEKRRKRV